MSIRAIARQFGRSRRKARDALANPEPQPYTRTKEAYAPKLRPFKATIDQILVADEMVHRDGMFVMAFPRECTEAFLEAHVAALAFFGFVPGRISYDNTKVALKQLGRQDLRKPDIGPHHARHLPDKPPQRKSAHPRTPMAPVTSDQTCPELSAPACFLHSLWRLLATNKSTAPGPRPRSLCKPRCISGAVWGAAFDGHAGGSILPGSPRPPVPDQGKPPPGAAGAPRRVRERTCRRPRRHSCRSGRRGRRCRRRRRR